MNNNRIIRGLICGICLLMLSACNASKQAQSPIEESESQPVLEVQFTATAIPPTQTPLPPTATATETSQPTPEGQIFRDDFTEGISPLMTWKNEEKKRWEITEEGFLKIIGQKPILLTDSYQENLLCTQLPSGDFSVSTHVLAAPSKNFQQAAIYIYQDTGNYVAINRGYCDLSHCGTGGNGFYMEYKVNGVWNAYHTVASSDDIYLKLEKVGTVLSGYYAQTPGDWQRLGRFGDLFDLKEVCIGAGNGEANGTSLVAKFDYIDISQP